jgi:uncharacterized protein (DUF4415 family)
MRKRAKERDYDVPELTSREIAEMRPAKELRPGFVAAYERTRGRPPKDKKKVPVTLRLDSDVVKALRASGPGWQTRTNAHLAKWTKKPATKRSRARR